jgi:hypothetical protein
MQITFAEKNLMPLTTLDPKTALIVVDLQKGMNWLHPVSYFFGGLFLANVVPHFVSGIIAYYGGVGH